MVPALQAQASLDAGNSEGGLLHEFFERQAALRPEADAVICTGKALTYGELDRRANQLAHALAAEGLGRGDCVGLLMPRSAQLYIGLLGILKAGAAYVPLDPEYPADRIQFILKDSQAQTVVTTAALEQKIRASELASTPPAIRNQDGVREFSPKTICLDRDQERLESLPAERLDLDEPATTPADLCYIIYTSGTTGRPKGVAIEHRSVCHLVMQEAALFHVQPTDRVYQGFSIAFDASVEEIWLAFFAGAALVVGTAEMLHVGPALATLLTEAGVTVLSCVPTLLAMMEQEVASVRLLILGGEVCPPELVKRWWTPSRRVVNTYGPTEATVIATWAECHPARPVTIGRPLPGYTAVILDEQLQPVQNGMSGELCLGGIGLARGYIGRPELTREKFIAVSLTTRESFGSPSQGGRRPGQRPVEGSPALRLYRTGDRARWTADGQIEFLGRLDEQVKLRGFRVELGEIEAALLECTDVLAAAVAVREEESGVQQLAAYLVPREEASPDLASLRARLRARLPNYMVPSSFSVLPSLPTLPSGKVDRKALPRPTRQEPERAETAAAWRTEREWQLADSWQRLFAPNPVCRTDDFFLDLGGHSLLAARMVSELRKNPTFASLSMLDVYQHPTIEGLAAKFDHEPQAGDQTISAHAQAPPTLGPEEATPVPFWRHFWCGAAQLLSLVFILSFFALQWLAPYLTFTILVEEEFDFVTAVLGAFASLLLLYPVMVVVPIIAKWVLIGRYKPGSYPLWGSFYFRWWLATTIESAVPVGYLAGTPLLNIYLRLMGARIGPHLHLDSDSFAIYDLVSIGEGSSVNADAMLLGYTVENGWLKLGNITIGRGCFVGARAAFGLDAVMEDDSALEDLSSLPRGARIPCGQTWLGSPAQASTVAAPVERTEAAPRPNLAQRFFFGCLHGIGLLIFPVLVVAALFPGIVVMNQLNYIDPYYWYLFLSPLVALSFVVLLCLEIAGLKWLLLGRIKAGRYRLPGFYYLRKWFVDQTMDLSLDILGPLYASIYLTPWYKLLGVRLGKGAEISTASFISPDLLSIGDESFIADSVSLGAPRVRSGWLTLGPNAIGKRAFIGNSALLPPGKAVGESVLIGCLSAPPANQADALRYDTSWLGSPSFELPQRQKSPAYAEETTFKPSAKLRVLRAAIEFVRVLTPSTCFIILLSLMFSVLLLLHDQYDLVTTLLFFPLIYLSCGVAAAALTIALKWLLVGRYRPGEKPLWSTFVWRNELVNALHEHLAEPFLIGTLTGTPFLSWYFRLLGAQVGRRVYMETTDFSEFDLARIGDEAALNADCTIQTHLFEDRVMKMGLVEVGSNCSVGAASLVLYDTQMQEGSALGDLSLLMKAERLPGGTRWQGIPARRVG